MNQAPFVFNHLNSKIQETESIFYFFKKNWKISLNLFLLYFLCYKQQHWAVIIIYIYIIIVRHHDLGNQTSKIHFINTPVSKLVRIKALRFAQKTKPKSKIHMLKNQ